jgi:hypothetical protein
MKRFLFLWAALGLCLGSAWADETVKAVQLQLKQRGFYQGSANGIYDSDTSAAVTRYQIRNGLAISGQLDAATLQALNVPSAAGKAAPEPSPVAGTWRRLRNGDMQFLKALNSGQIPPPKAPPGPSPGKTAAPKVAESNKKVMLDPHGPPPPLPEDVPQPPPGAQRQNASPRRGGVEDKERLRDYVGAFVLAGLAPQVGAELEFFADRVDYFGEANTSREKIRRDLLSYDKRWPQRRFWLNGDIETGRTPEGMLRVTFPLRYELRNGSKSASGQVRKTLILRKADADDLEIVGVQENKM